jgi:uncharacterized cupin superfamily protein
MRDAGVVTARLRRDRLLAIQIGKWEDVMKRLLTVGAGVLLATSVAFAQAITPPAKEPTRRTPLQKTEFPDGHVIYMQLLEAEPGTPVPRHTHPGVETSYVLEGELELSVEGKAPVLLKAGESALPCRRIPRTAARSARSRRSSSSPMSSTRPSRSHRPRHRSSALGAPNSRKGNKTGRSQERPI